MNPSSGRRFSSPIFGAIFLWAALAGAAHGQNVYSPAAISGQQAPGTASGITFSSFIWPVINNSGKVAFTAGLNGPGVDSPNDTGIWSNSPGALGLVARAGSSAPGSSGLFAPLFGIGIVLDANGGVSFESSLTGFGINSTNGSGIWSGPPGALLVVALAGMHAPGTAGEANYADLFSPADSNGGLAFKADLTGANTVGASRGIWSGTANAISLALRAGDPAPGTEAGTAFSEFYNFVVNPSGQIAVMADVSSGGARGIWRGPPGALSLVARDGMIAPGTGGWTFSDMGVVDMNAAGHVLFDAQTTNGTASGSGLWSGTPGSLTLVARTATQAPGMPAGTLFTLFFEHYISANDHLVFSAFDSTNDYGLWSGTPGAVSLVAHAGNPAPGAPGEHFTAINPPEINRAGQVAFFSQIEPAPQAGLRGIWATDLNGALHLLALEGNSIDLGGGDVRQISFLSFREGGGNEDGLASSLNDGGVLAFQAKFTDGTQGVFTTVVPAPLRISSIQKSGNDVQIKFPSAIGQSYQLEYKNNLTDSSWLPLGATISGTGGTKTATDFGGASQPHRFYHIVQS